mmetsp:Transcript_133680/g.387022  ORF Transcript_133680/g.387022 Transcript_133680/m.387022 type:complete len:255 (+) Transcript_133680:1042-1806(+)
MKPFVTIWGPLKADMHKGTRKYSPRLSKIRPSATSVNSNKSYPQDSPLHRMLCKTSSATLKEIWFGSCWAPTVRSTPSRSWSTCASNCVPKRRRVNCAEMNSARAAPLTLVESASSLACFFSPCTMACTSTSPIVASMSATLYMHCRIFPNAICNGEFKPSAEICGCSLVCWMSCSASCKPRESSSKAVPEKSGAQSSSSSLSQGFQVQTWSLPPLCTPICPSLVTKSVPAGNPIQARSGCLGSSTCIVTVRIL